MRFKILAGQHIQGDKTQPIVNETGKHPSKTYDVGSVVESDIDLAKKHGYDKFQLLADKRSTPTSKPIPKQVTAQPAIPQFEEVEAELEEDENPVPPAPQEEGEEAAADEDESPAITREELQSMSLKELRAYAQEMGINTSNMKDKNTVIAAILDIE